MVENVYLRKGFPERGIIFQYTPEVGVVIPLVPKKVDIKPIEILHQNALENEIFSDTNEEEPVQEVVRVTSTFQSIQDFLFGSNKSSFWLRELSIYKNKKHGTRNRLLQ